MKYFIIAGEQSGDLHGSNLVKSLKQHDSEAEFFCWGGDLLQEAGAKLLKHYRELAFMGFVAVIKNLPTISRNMKLCIKQIKEIQPDVVILIDYPGFNLRIAEWAKKNKFRTFYYISPKLWAWNESRVKKIKKYIDRMFIIFPFEVEFYRKHGIEVTYYGNPLVDETEKRIAAFPPEGDIRKELNLDNRPVIALLAGSRKHEIEMVLPQMQKVMRHFRDFQFVLAGVKNIPDELYRKIIGTSGIRLVKEKTYETLKIADAALVTSGTATLETAIIGTPQVVCYKGDFFSMIIAWIVIKVKYISLVNLIMGDEVIKELVQYDLTEKNLVRELKAILHDGDKREKMLADYKALRERIGPAGASSRVAEQMIKELTNQRR